MSKKISRREFMRMATLGSSAALLAACAPEVITETKIEQQTQIVKETQVVEVEVEKVITATPLPVAEAKPAVVRYMCPTWASTQDRRQVRQIAFRSVIDSFNNQYKDHGWSVQEIPFDGDSVQLTQQIEQGAVDVIWYNHSEYLTRVLANQMAALDPWLNGQEQEFFPWVVDTMRSSPDGKIYSLWHNTDTPLYYYNTEKIPTPPKTWNEVIELCREVRDNEGGNKYAFTHPFVGWTQMNSGMFLALGGVYLDEDGAPIAFDGDNMGIWEEMFAYYKQLIDEDLIPAGAANQDQQQQMPDVYAGNVYSFGGNSNFHVRQLEPNLPAEEYAKWSAAPLPHPDRVDHGLYEAGGWLIGAIANSDPNVEAASAAFVLHSTNENSQAMTNNAGVWIPTRYNILATDPFYANDPFIETTLQALNDGHIVPQAPIYAPMMTTINNALSKAVTGVMSIEEALAEAREITLKEYQALK